MKAEIDVVDIVRMPDGVAMPPVSMMMVLLARRRRSQPLMIRITVSNAFHPRFQKRHPAASTQMNAYQKRGAKEDECTTTAIKHCTGENR